MSDLFRVLAFGRMIGQPMSASELSSYESALASNCAAGLADFEELVVERRDADGSWHVDHIVNGGASADLFTNPEAA